jgi:tRNA-splicing ligase RtcB
MSDFDELNVSGGAPVKIWTRNVAIDDDAIEQMCNVARLPIIHRHVAAMAQSFRRRSASTSAAA